MTKIGIAISCYDKFDELELLIDMIRSWGGEYVIGLCCNHPDGKKFKEYVDYYVQGRDIPFVKGDSREETFFLNQDDNYSIRLRAADCVRMACWLLTEKSDCDWIVHVHSDAWFLSEDGLKKFIYDCIRRQCLAACRGTGIESIANPCSSTSAHGQADDHFFAFNREAADFFKLWYYRPEDMFMRKYSVHGVLMTIFAVKLGLRRIWYYKRFAELLNCYSEPSVDNESKPCVYDAEYGFLHIHRGSLPVGVGEALQAHFILRYCDVDTIPDSWKEFVGICSIDNVISLIRGYNELLNKILKRMLYPRKILDKTRITYKELLIDNFTYADIYKNIKKRIMNFAYYKIFPHTNVIEQYRDFNKIVPGSWDEWW